MLSTEFVITEFVITEFVITEFVITEFLCITRDGFWRNAKVELLLKLLDIYGLLYLSYTSVWGRVKNSEHKIFSKKKKKLKPNFSESKNVIRKMKRIEIAFCKEHFKKICLSWTKNRYLNRCLKEYRYTVNSILLTYKPSKPDKMVVNL